MFSSMCRLSDWSPSGYSNTGNLSGFNGVCAPENRTGQVCDSDGDDETCRWENGGLFCAIADYTSITPGITALVTYKCCTDYIARPCQEVLMIL